MTLLKPTDLYAYQKEAVLHQLYHPKSMLWLDMGLGKTPVTLTTIDHRQKQGVVKKVLIFGPVRVIHGVWARESRKWEHTRHLRCNVLSGNPDQRIKALFADADIYLCSYENMNWLAGILKEYYLDRNFPLPFQMVVYDEVSKMKNPSALRYKGGKRERKDKHTGHAYEIDVTGWKAVADLFPYTTGLTGTPASNGYIDLFGQYLVVDGGQRLGKFITHYRDNYFASDYMGWSYSPTPEGKTWIEHNISDITIKMDAKEYLDLPDSIEVNLMVDMPPRAREHYKEIEKQMFTELDTMTKVEVFSKNSISNKCLQICQGAAYYDDQGNWEKIHDAKLEALEDVLEEAAGKPVLVAYAFRADAERIMQKFKNYKPVNMTGEKASSTERIVDDWNAGKIKLMIGHPACLHPRTQVLTERRGWVKIIDVKVSDRVFDGVEFVSHDGCSYSGYNNVVDVFGITMTPDHKLLVSNEWKEAEDVRNCRSSKREALYQYQGDDCYLSEMFALREGVKNSSSECSQTQSTRKGILSALYSRYLPQSNRYTNMANMAGYEEPRQRPNRSQLRWAWDSGVRRMDEFFYVLRRHALNLRRRFNNRTDRCEQALLQRQLHMGDSFRTAVQQAKQSVCDIQGRAYSFSGTLSSFGFQQNNVNEQVESRNDSRRSSTGCTELSLWKGHEAGECEAQTKAHVYDLVNCGPRNRFVIRNDSGEVFISHNSMGHGIDGLQDSGSIVVWYGLNWSLELYDQMNKRIDRAGQKNSVRIIRILCRDTVDLAVADALMRKRDDENGLKESIQRYRDGKVNNDLTISFM